MDEFALTIHNFNSSIDDGHYWCQIVVDGSCPLEPSPIGFIALGQFPVTKCAYNIRDFIEFDIPPICAEETPCIEDTLTTFSVRATEIATKSQSITIMTVAFYGIIGGLVFIIILLLLIIIACTVCNVRNRKMHKAKQRGK